MKNSGLDQLSESVCRHRRAITISACITAALLWTVVVISWGLSLVVNPEVAEESTMEEGMPSLRSFDLWPNDYQHTAFQKTLKSCDPNTNSKCMSFVPDGAKGERIAVLSPPGALGLLFENFIAEVVQLHSLHSNATNLELIRSSHVPPYGYGKTHGITKIIRFVAMPLRLAAADLVLEQIKDGIAPIESVQSVDIKQATRQIVRWNCRLSHVAAHTSLLTISLEGLIEEAWETEYLITCFLNLKPKGYSLEDHLLGKLHIDEDEMAGSLAQVVHQAEALLLRIENLEQIPNKMEGTVDEVVDEELMVTNNLKDWPCLAFWNAGDQLTPTDMNVIGKHNAQALSPKCDGEFTSCFVQRDKCEAKGDAICQENAQ